MTTEQSKHYRNEKETVKTLLRDYPANGKIGAKSLKHLLRESKRLFLQTKLAADTLWKPQAFAEGLRMGRR